VAAAVQPLARISVDALAGSTGCDVGSDLLDRAGEFSAGRRREGRHKAVSTGADQSIQDAHANLVRPDQNFARFQFGDGLSLPKTAFAGVTVGYRIRA
jgi:hypothetical protein